MNINITLSNYFRKKLCPYKTVFNFLHFAAKCKVPILLMYSPADLSVDAGNLRNALYWQLSILLHNISLNSKKP